MFIRLVICDDLLGMLECDLGMNSGFCSRKQGECLLFSLKRARLA